MDSSYARDGDPIGTPIFRSPEAHLQMSWSTATDIWSFGAMASFELPYWTKVCHLKSNFLGIAAYQSHVWGRLPHL